MARDNEQQRIGDPTRRALLGTTAAGASGLIAGCSGGGGDGGDGGGDTTAPGTATGTGGGGPTQTPTQTTQGPLPEVQGQTLTWYTMQNPDTLTWFLTGTFPGPVGKYRPNWTRMSVRLTMQNSGRGPWLNNPIKTGEFMPETFESYDIQPDEMTIKIRDEAKWSNGDDVTSQDALADTVAFLLFPDGDLLPDEERDVDYIPVFHGAIDDWEIVDDKTFKFISEEGDFDKFMPQDIWADMCWDAYWGGVWANTNVEPYDKWWNTLSDWWETAKEKAAGKEIADLEPPWTSDHGHIFNALKEVLMGEYGWSASPEKNNYDFHWEKHFRKGENVHTTGAWTLDSINGQQSITLVPNEHHYRADQVNFNEIKVVVRNSDRANRSALKANSQDYYRGDVPQYIAKSFPEDIEQRQVRANSGLAYAFNHQYKLFENRDARQAIMYAIDRERIAKSVHRTKFDVVQRGGAHGYRTTDVLGEEFVNNTYISHERDLDKANSLMQSAGFHKEGGKWVDEEGNALSLEIPTAAQTPKLGPAFANQLSQFGIDASLQTYSGSVFSEKKNNGEFNIWQTGFGTGYALSCGNVWYWFPRLKPWALNWFRIWTEEEINQLEWRSNGAPRHNYPNWWKPLTIEAPPVGKPDGDLQEWSPASIGMRVQFPQNPDQFAADLKRGTWLYNWYMPLIPIANGTTQNFLDTGHWLYPGTDSKDWEGVGVGTYQPEGMVAYGVAPQADPDNPESGASVQN